MEGSIWKVPYYSIWNFQTELPYGIYYIHMEYSIIEFFGRKKEKQTNKQMHLHQSPHAPIIDVLIITL